MFFENLFQKIKEKKSFSKIQNSSLTVKTKCVFVQNKMSTKLSVFQKVGSLFCAPINTIAVWTPPPASPIAAAKLLY